MFHDIVVATIALKLGNIEFWRTIFGNERTFILYVVLRIDVNQHVSNSIDTLTLCSICDITFNFAAHRERRSPKTTKHT